MPCGVRDKFFLNPHFVIRDAGTLRWFAGLPAAVCGWTLEAIKPDIYTKGADYTLETLPERDIVIKNNIKVEFIDFVAGKSTTNVIKKCLK